MDHSPFAKLPAELRVYIWELSLKGTKSINLLGIKRYLALTQTCRQIWCEAHPIFWSLNSFHHSFNTKKTWPTWMAQLAGLLRELGPMTLCSIPRLEMTHYNDQKYPCDYYQIVHIERENAGAQTLQPANVNEAPKQLTNIIDMYKSCGIQLRTIRRRTGRHESVWYLACVHAD
jgi:hypothetical protein